MVFSAAARCGAVGSAAPTLSAADCPPEGPTPDGPASGKTAFTIIQVETRKLQGCRIHLPEDYDSTRAYPLVIGLHGFGGNARGFSRIWDYLERHPFIFAVPEAPYALGDPAMESTNQFSWEFRGDDAGLWRSADPWVPEYIAAVADSVAKRYRVGATFIFGFSQGAAYAYATGIRYPGRFAGIICFGGRMPDPRKYEWLLNDEIIKRGSGLKVFIAHGRNDDVIGCDAALESARMLQDRGYDVKTVLFEGGHTIVRGPLLTALEWLEIQ